MWFVSGLSIGLDWRIRFGVSTTWLAEDHTIFMLKPSSKVKLVLSPKQRAKPKTSALQIDKALVAYLG